MFKIVNKRSLNPTVTLMDIEAPLVAKKAEAGQFIILRTDDDGERIPLTVAGFDREKGTVRIIFQIVGATTEKLNTKIQVIILPILQDLSVNPPKPRDCVRFALWAAA